MVMVVIVLSGCADRPPKVIDIRGSWYTDETKGQSAEPFDGIDYTEVYFGDTSWFAQNDAYGTLHISAYKVTSDSIYLGDDSHHLEPREKILSLKGDTLWLKINPKFSRNLDTVYWVRLPKGEFGYYDQERTPQNEDSLYWKTVFDYDRRKWKFWAYKTGNMTVYDSMLAAGHWAWTMDSIKDDNE
jgi:hypothetical protein